MIIAGCGSQKNQNNSNMLTGKDSTSVEHEMKDTIGLPDKALETLSNDIKPQAAEGFVIISSYSQKWQGGVKGSGGGIKYNFELLASYPSSQLIIDQVWIGQQYFDASASRKFPKTAADGFNKGDTIYVYINYMTKVPDHANIAETTDGQKEIQESMSSIPPPYAYKGEALIGYKINGSRKYKEITQVTAKSPLYYP